MKKLVLGLVASLALASAAPAFANEQDDAAALIMDNYKAGAVCEADARGMIEKVYSPYEIGAGAAWLIQKLYQGGKWLVVDGIGKSSWSLITCALHSIPESTAFVTCKAVALTKGSDADVSCWEKAYLSKTWQAACKGSYANKEEVAPAIDAPAAQ